MRCNNELPKPFEDSELLSKGYEWYSAIFDDKLSEDHEEVRQGLKLTYST